MMKINFIVLILVISHGYNVAALDFEKCSIQNSTCQQLFYQSVASTYAVNGIEEIGVPPLDPFHLKNVTITAMDLVKLTLVEGDCLGISTCRLLKYKTNLTNFHKIAEIKCARIVIQGSYLLSNHPNFSQMLGNLTGSGNVSVVLEDWYFKFDYPFAFVKHEDGEIYTKAYFEQGTYVSKVLKNASIAADNIMVNDRDVTVNILKFMNIRWNLIFGYFIESFHEKSVGFYYEIYAKFFDNVPATKYLSDDLTPYLKTN